MGGGDIFLPGRAGAQEAQISSCENDRCDKAGKQVMKTRVPKTWGFPSQFIKSTKVLMETWVFPSQFIKSTKVLMATTRAPPGVPHTQASLEPGTS